MHFLSLVELYQGLGDIATHVVAKESSQKRRDLRGTDQKRSREKFQAFIFARAMQGALKLDNMWVGFPEAEDCDHDAVLGWFENEQKYHLQVQLKEIPPSSSLRR